MELYFEQVVLENFVIDFLLLYLSFDLTAEERRIKRLVVASTVGSTLAVIFPLLNLPSVLTHLFRYGTGVVICTVAFYGKKARVFRRILRFCTVFFLLTFAFGGVQTAIFQVYGEKNGVPVYELLATGGVFFLLCRAVVTKVTKKLKAKRYLYQCTVYFGKRKTECLALWDSGNTAKADGISICFMSSVRCLDLFLDEEPTGETVVTTVGGRKKIQFFTADRIDILDEKKHTIEKVPIAPSSAIIGKEYALLLGRDTLPTERKEL